MSADGPTWVSERLSDSLISLRCDAAAPLVVNGAGFVGCSLDEGHEGPHKVEMTWQR